MAITFYGITRQDQIRSLNIIADHTTANESFLKMHEYLKEFGYTNCEFMLSLYDQGLQGVDPHAVSGTLWADRIYAECSVNPWYFFREVLRLPAAGKASGQKFELNVLTMSLIWNIFSGMDVFVEAPRQTGKTSVLHALAVYFKMLSTEVLGDAYYPKGPQQDYAESDIQEISDLLPAYLKTMGNGEIIIMPVVHAPEFEYWDNFSGNSDAAAIWSRNDYEDCISQVICTNACNQPSEARTFAMRLRENYFPFHHSMYEVGLPEQLIRSQDNNLAGILLSFSASELGKSQSWLTQMAAGRDICAIASELFNDWGNT